MHLCFEHPICEHGVAFCQCVYFWVLLWLFYYKEIKTRIAELDQDHVIKRTRLRVSDSVKRRCEEWQRLLRTNWKDTHLILSDLEEGPELVPCQGPSRT